MRRGEIVFEADITRHFDVNNIFYNHKDFMKNSLRICKFLFFNEILIKFEINFYRIIYNRIFLFISLINKNFKFV